MNDRTKTVAGTVAVTVVAEKVEVQTVERGRWFKSQYPCCPTGEAWVKMSEQDTTFKKKCPTCGARFTTTVSVGNKGERDWAWTGKANAKAAVVAVVAPKRVAPVAAVTIAPEAIVVAPKTGVRAGALKPLAKATVSLKK